jgi:hypothetical protein
VPRIVRPPRHGGGRSHVFATLEGKSTPPPRHLLLGFHDLCTDSTGFAQPMRDPYRMSSLVSSACVAHQFGRRAHQNCIDVNVATGNILLGYAPFLSWDATLSMRATR